MFVPPVQAHFDAVIFAETLDSHTEVLDTDHEEEHHQNDSEDSKNTEHHHHCTSLGFSSALISLLLFSYAFRTHFWYFQINAFKHINI